MHADFRTLINEKQNMFKEVCANFKVYSDFDLFCKCLFICRCQSQPQELD